MNILSGPRGIIAFDQDKTALEKIKEAWPSNGEVLRISEWNDPKKDRRTITSKRQRRLDAAAAPTNG